MSDNTFEYMDHFINRRVAQLHNTEEIYKNYNYTKNLERDVAMYELIIIQLCHKFFEFYFNEGEVDLEDLYIETIDTLGGQLDEVAMRLFVRCDKDKQMPLVHEFVEP